MAHFNQSFYFQVSDAFKQKPDWKLTPVGKALGDNRWLLKREVSVKDDPERGSLCLCITFDGFPPRTRSIQVGSRTLQRSIDAGEITTSIRE
jgi:hypothetical protein